MKKYDIKSARDLFDNRGLILLESDYINDTTKMRYRCKNHINDIFEITFNKLKAKKGNGCPKCSGKYKYTHKDVKELFLSRNLVLLSEYKNANELLDFRCSKHKENIQQTKFRDFRKMKHICKQCAKESLSNLKTGSNHHNWQGGISSLNMYLRSQLSEWKFESLKSTNFKCFITGVNHKDLEVHHLIPFKKIRDKVLDEFGINQCMSVNEIDNELLESIKSELLLRHNSLLGIPLRECVHTLFHKVYGLDTTPKQFEDFVIRYNEGEFGSLKGGK